MSSENPGSGPKMGLVDDWTHHHVIFPDPGTATDAMARGRYEDWYRVASNPRFLMQQMKRNRPLMGGVRVLFGAVAAGPHRDWAFSLGSGTVAENMFPAKFGFDINATPSCALDYVTYGLNVAGTTGGQANLVALNNLYSGTSPTGICGTTPTIYWAYNASIAGGKITTSPVLSMDGSKLIFIESGGSTGPYLHVLQWKSGEGTVAASKAPTHVLAAGQGVSNCASGASCLVSILLNSTTETITNSSPYYDYGSDTAYVGDDNGNLYKVTPVLGSGAPVVKRVSVAAGTELTGPTYDNASGNVFVGSTNGALSAVKASTFSSVAATNQIGDQTSNCSGGFNNKLVDAPIVDSTNGWVYEYVTADATPNTVVVQLSTAGPFSTKNVVTLGNGDATCGSVGSFPTHMPAFDSNYISGTITNGHMWVCGRQTGTLSEPVLWEIPTSGAKGSIAGVTAVQNGAANQVNEIRHAQCSPFTAVTNGAKDYLFFGEGLNGDPTYGPFGSFYGFTISGATATAISGSPITYPNATGGTSAMVIDNVSSAAQASSVYFTTLAPSTAVCGLTSAYCAIKLTQSALQ